MKFHRIQVIVGNGTYCRLRELKRKHRMTWNDLIVKAG